MGSLTLAPGVLDAMRAQLGCAAGPGGGGVRSAEACARLASCLDTMTAGGESTLPDGLARLFDGYRDEWLEASGIQWTERVHQLPTVPDGQRSALARAFAASSHYPSSARLFCDTGVPRGMDWVPAPLGAVDVRPSVSRALGIGDFELPDGALIVGFLQFVQVAWDWGASLHAEESPIDSYTADFIARGHPVTIGPGRQRIHDGWLCPLECLYHDLSHLVVLCEKYPPTDSGRAAHAAQVRLYHVVCDCLRERGLADVRVWIGGTLHTVRSRLCEGLSLDGAQLDTRQGIDRAAGQEILDLVRQLTD